MWTERLRNRRDIFGASISKRMVSVCREILSRPFSRRSPCIKRISSQSVRAGGADSARLILGSVAEALIKRAGCPVLTVRNVGAHREEEWR